MDEVFTLMDIEFMPWLNNKGVKIGLSIGKLVTRCQFRKTAELQRRCLVIILTPAVLFSCLTKCVFCG